MVQPMSLGFRGSDTLRERCWRRHHHDLPRSIMVLLGILVRSLWYGMGGRRGSRA